MKAIPLNSYHLPTCAKMYVTTFNGPPWFDKWTQDTAHKRLEDIMDSPGFIGMAVAVDDQLRAAVFGNIESWYEGKMFTLKEMFVHHEEKGRGLGTFLMEALEVELAKMNVTSISLFTSKGDLTEKFYMKNGFESDNDMTMMSKSLAAI